MDGRMYIAPLVALTVTNDADQDIFEIVGPSAKPIILHGFSLSSATLTDERVALKLVRRSTTGTGGTGLTEVPIEDGNTMAAEAAVSSLVTAPGTIGDILAAWQWSQQGELLFLPTPKMQPVLTAGARLCLHLTTAVASSRTWSGWVMWEELG